MKKLLFLFALLFSLSVSAQDVQIPLQRFTLQLDSVETLAIRPVGAPYKAINPADSSIYIAQPVYYRLIRASGKQAEEGNIVLPMPIYQLINKYVTGDITQSDIDIINAFCQANGYPNIVAKLPEN